MSQETEIIECHECESKVRANVIAFREVMEIDGPLKISFLECPACQSVMIGGAWEVQVGENKWDFANPIRFWPRPNEFLDWTIPHPVRKSLEEARSCFQAKAYSACAVMCGRALEAVCKTHKTKDWKLASGLKELREKKVIDGRLFDWGEALRKHRNIGAHATGVDVTREDASDLLDFSIAICDYVYVLSEKYVAFKKRQQEGKSTSSRKTSSGPYPNYEQHSEQ